MTAFTCCYTSIHKTTKLSQNAVSGLRSNLFTAELELINVFAVIIFTDQVIIMHNEKITTHPLRGPMPVCNLVPRDFSLAWGRGGKRTILNNFK